VRDPQGPVPVETVPERREVCRGGATQVRVPLRLSGAVPRSTLRAAAERVRRAPVQGARPLRRRRRPPRGVPVPVSARPERAAVRDAGRRVAGAQRHRLLVGDRAPAVSQRRLVRQPRRRRRVALSLSARLPRPALRAARHPVRLVAVPQRGHLSPGGQVLSSDKVLHV